MVADGFGVGDGARFQLGVERFVGVDIDEKGMRGQRLHQGVVVDFADAAAGVVDKSLITVEALGALDKGGDVVHRRALGFVKQPLPFDEGAGVVAVAPQFADESGKDMQPFDAHFALDADRIIAQKRRQRGLAPRQHGQPVADGLVQIAGGDAVIAGIMKPAGAMQQGCQRGLADAGGTHQSNAGNRGHNIIRLHKKRALY